ncbi:MAG: glycosyltransferase family 9 protein [Bacteroidia bacterium]|nr:glycosyltransferase family 9 protein [Bacteroidia bacterium]
MKALIIQTAFIGDVILATPLISELNRCIPGIETDVLVRSGNETLLTNFPGIRKILTWDKKNDKQKHLLEVLSAIRKEKYDLVINLQRFASTGFLTAFSKAKEKIGFSKNPFSFLFDRSVEHKIGERNLHETSRNLQLIGHLGADLNARPVLYPSAVDFKTVQQFKTEPYFCIAPTSVWFTKQVPASKWLELIHRLLSTHPKAKIYLLGGPSDQQACEQLRMEGLSENLTNLSGRLSFLQTAALMKDAVWNFVNDSAPLHMASAMNAPVTVFFCSTIPGFGFGPLSDLHEITEVKGLSCRPCGLHGHKSCPEGHFKCALQLDMNPEAYLPAL